jgi:hypothetical protein
MPFHFSEVPFHFDYHNPTTTHFKRSEGWHFARMHMVFDIKADGRFKARLCVGGNVVDCDNYTTFSSTIKDISIRLLTDGHSG